MTTTSRGTFGGQELVLVQGDITQQAVDAVVNAANAQLAGGAGVDGAIHRVGGPTIMEETRTRYPAGCPTGSAVITSGGKLNARYVIHGVGPVWRGGTEGEPDLLAGVHRTALELAVQHDCQSIAFPAISTGVYGYPLSLAASVALQTTTDFLNRQHAPTEVRFVLFGQAAYDVFAATLAQLVEATA